MVLRIRDFSPLNAAPLLQNDPAFNHPPAHFSLPRVTNYQCPVLTCSSCSFLRALARAMGDAFSTTRKAWTDSRTARLTEGVISTLYINSKHSAALGLTAVQDSPHPTKNTPPQKSYTAITEELYSLTFEAATPMPSHLTRASYSPPPQYKLPIPDSQQRAARRNTTIPRSSHRISLPERAFDIQALLCPLKIHSSWYNSGCPCLRCFQGSGQYHERMCVGLVLFQRATQVVNTQNFSALIGRAKRTKVLDRTPGIYRQLPHSAVGFHVPGRQ